MAEISEARRSEVERLKDQIGWSWNEVAKRTGWGPVGLQRFRTMKIAIDDRWLWYLGQVAAAVSAIPMPSDQVEKQVDVAIPDDVAAKMRAAGLTPAPAPQSTEVRVMMLDDIAAKLANEYVETRNNGEMTGEERTGAFHVITRLAEQFGVIQEVRRLIGAPSGGLTPRVPAPAAPWEPPVFRNDGQQSVAAPTRIQPPPRGMPQRGVREPFEPNDDFLAAG